MRAISTSERKSDKPKNSAIPYWHFYHMYDFVFVLGSSLSSIVTIELKTLFIAFSSLITSNKVNRVLAKFIPTNVKSNSIT